ncbi:hypothetical protein Vretifemale_4496 [Volvox reticuliferus]|nr:hypothetical protein Vretifemale_4496 [Volvox reticuliferus]
METQGSSPVAGTRRLAVKRPSEEADAEVLEAEEVDGGFDVAAPAGLSPAPMAHAGRVIDRGYAALVDLGDPTYAAAMTRGAFRRTRPTEWQAVKRMRPAAAAEAAIAPMRAGEETLGTTTTTALAATEEDCDRPSSRGGGEDTYGPARRWHGPITPSAAAAWYAAIAAGASGAAAAAALPRGTFWGPIWPQRLAEQEPYVPAVGRGPPSARQSCNASAGPFVTAPAAAAAAALAEAEDLSVEELHHVLLSALQRREQQLIKQQLQEQQSIRWQQQEALVRLVEATGLRPVLAPDAAAFLDELSVTAGDNKRMAWQSSGAAGVIQSRKRAAGVSVGVNDKLYEDAIPAAQMRATRQLVALPLPAPPPQQRKSSGGGAVATAPPCSLPGSAVTPDSPTSSSSGGGGGTRDVRFLADAPTPATAPQPVAAAETTAAPANKSHHLSPTLPRRTYTDSDVNLGTDCAADAKGGCSGRSSDDTADRSDTHPSALDGKAAKDAAPAAATTSSGADTAATGPVTRPSQKWRLPGFPPYHVRERELDRAPTVRVSFGRDGQYDGYAGTSTAGIDDEHSIEVPLLLRVPSSMQQQILGMLQLQLADASQQSQPQLVRTQSQGTHEEGRDVPKAPRIELVSEE